MRAHYACARCDGLFEDEAGAIPTTVEKLTVPKIEVIEKITVTEDLEEKGIKNEDDVRDKLEEAAENEGYDRENTQTVEVTIPAEQELDAPITILLPYPAGTDMDHFEFDVFHMITLGEKAGDTELIACTKTPNGLLITVSGLSPFTIAWEPVLDGNPATSAYFLANDMAAFAAENLRKAVGN